MNTTQELERLAKLHAEGALTAEEFAQAKRRLLSSPEAGAVAPRGIRRQSSRTICGLPLWAIAMGPDPEHGERRGHARAIFALGDIATGCFALGGLARGIFALGGCAIGGVALGGAAIGVIAVGGAVIGGVAVGGAACGYYAIGGSAFGAHSISAAHRDPEAVKFFERFWPWQVGNGGR